jgi:hypothetical protein
MNMMEKEEKMKTKHYLIVVLSLLSVLCFFSAAARAEIHEMHFNAYTTNYTDRSRMDFWIRVSDTLARPPIVVSSLVVLAPDGTLFDMTNHTWNDLTKDYFYAAQPEDFDTGVIPSGTYYARVIDLWGNQIINYDDVQVGFLDPPVLTNPTEGSTVGLTPTITWNTVPGAMRYRILLYNGDHTSRGDPIYWYAYNVKYVYRTSFPIPKGVLRPGRSYLIQIEARDTDKDTEKRSRCDWVQFYTAP